MALHHQDHDNCVRKRLPGQWCVYCGEPATTNDHFPPRSLGPKGWMLPCCRQCNTQAGTRWGTDFSRRCQYLKLMIEIKYKRALKTPDWSKEEIDTLGYNMRTSVIKWQRIKKRAQERLAWNVASYLACIDHSNDFAQWLVETVTTTKPGSGNLKSSAEPDISEILEG